ncbi:MAG: cation:proton antiporter, partial [Gammaproteobacteria bacterium]|nr:cation:proton antiporter [Gammaproteobacteria bacterium]
MSLGVVESFFLIFSGAALLATVALYTRQPLLVAYIGIGMLLGPHALGWIPDAAFVEDTGEIGIIFLLFLLGLDLPPNKLRTMLGASVVTALVSTAVFFAVGFAVMASFGFSVAEALVGGI